MKAFGFVALLLVLGVAGYLMVGRGPGAAGATAASQLDQAAQAKGMEDKARNAMGQADLAQLRTQITAFQAAKGRKPASLDELKDAGFIGSIPAGVSYDPATGDVTPGP
jgi:competence protein ComGC